MSNVKDYPAGTGIGDRLAEVQRIKLQIDALEAKLDEHKAYLLGHAIRNNLDALRHGALVLSRRARATWVYSQAIKAAEAKLKQRKLSEQEAGIAVAKETEHLVVSFSAKVALANQLIEA
jgi:hypothetical protein